jgi:hypothetical protein
MRLSSRARLEPADRHQMMKKRELRGFQELETVGGGSAQDHY